MKSFTRLFQRPAAMSTLIDARQLMHELSDADLLQAADGYFSSLTVDSEQCYKPFSNAHDAIHITGHLSLLFQAAEIFHSADVLDFGCATGWLTIALADLGAMAVGVDISPSAVALAEELKARHSARPTGSARFLAYDGQCLPLADESVDRVVCFDSFHHVKDQAHALREFARVLRPGGRLAMLEPGPNHSRTPQSQMEMTRYKVLENDIVMADIAAAGLQAGLSSPRMLVQFQKPLTVPLDQFEDWAGTGDLPSHEEKLLLSSLRGAMTDTQCFYMTKGQAGPDSRHAAALAAELRLISWRPADVGSGLEFHLRIRNTGNAFWFTEPGRIGQVNLGCQLLTSEGAVQDLNHGRFSLGRERVESGAEFDLVVRLPAAPLPGSFLRFDLVSEQVAWFEQLGRCQPVEWHSST